MNEHDGFRLKMAAVESVGFGRAHAHLVRTS